MKMSVTLLFRLYAPIRQKQNDEDRQIRIGDLQDSHPQGDEGQVQDEKTDIADVHAGDDPPEEIRGSSG